MTTELRHYSDINQIDRRADFDHIRYANCWEDADVLRCALDPGPGDSVLSIASAGDNSLELLATGAKVVAVDVSAVQLGCVDLRAAAFRNLDYQGMLRFLGVRPADDRLNTYRQLRGDLSDESARFWDAHPALIDDGIIFAGKFERYLRAFGRWMLPLIHSEDTVQRLMDDKPLPQRRQFYENRWNSRRWKLLFRLFFNRKIMGWRGRDAEFFRYVDGPVSAEMLRRVRRALTEMPTHDNPYLTFILNGNFGDTLPAYLRRDRFEAIRDGLDRLTLYRGTVEDAARHFGDTGFDAFNLSDIFEYLDEELSRQVFEQLLESARPGARFAYWNLFVPRRGHELVPGRLIHRPTVSEKLHQQDRAFFYGEFIVEEASR